MIMKKTVFILLLSLGFTCAQGQEVYNSSGKPGFHKKTSKHKGYDPSKLILGGEFTLNFGGGYIAAGIAPMVGYRFSKNFEAGIAVGYLYNQQPDQYFTNNYPYPSFYDKSNVFYPSIWTRYFVYRGLYVTGQLEYDFISLKEPIDNVGDMASENVNATCLLMGLGLKQPIGGRASFFIEVMYDVLQEQNSPYLNNIVPRAGIAVGM